MKTKFNILCAFIVLAIIAGMTTIGGAIGKDDVQDFKDGYEQGWESAREGEAKYTQKWQYIDVIPVDSVARGVVYDAKTGQAYETKVSSTHMTVKLDTPSKTAETIGAIGTGLAELFIIFFWAWFVRFIFLVNKGVFNDDQVKKIRWMGWFAIAVYPAKWLAVGVPQMMLRRSVSLEGYEIVQYMPSVMWLIIGCALLMFSLIMKMGQEMKQEQDLTI